MKTFLEALYEAPLEIRGFLYSDDFYSFLDEYTKKFELNEEQETEFIYLLQDLSIKLIDENADLKTIIKERLGLNDENSAALAYHIKTKFLPLVNNIWQSIQKKAEKEEKIIKEAPKELVDIIKKVKERQPSTKVLNLQKIIPPKKEFAEIEKKKEEAIDLSKTQPIKTEIPKKVVDINQTISWSPPKPKEIEGSGVVIIKKQKEENKKEEGVIDLSNL